LARGAYLLRPSNGSARWRQRFGSGGRSGGGRRPRLVPRLAELRALAEGRLREAMATHSHLHPLVAHLWPGAALQAAEVAALTVGPAPEGIAPEVVRAWAVEMALFGCQNVARVHGDPPGADLGIPMF
jgi:hypothetical protein